MTASTTPSPLARIAGALTVLLGMLVVAGWSLDIPALKSVLRGAVEMKANTAVALVLAGAALFISGSRAAPPLQGLARAMALIVAALGLVTLSQYVFGWRLGIDELLFRDTANAYNAIPGRMSPYIALAFGVNGLALAVVPSTRPHQLGMDVVAEGVEDWNDWNFLRETGCGMAQGYFIAKPMPAEALAARAQDWEDRVEEFATLD